MKVKVTPPYEGAGSFEVEVESCQTAYSSEDCGEVTKIYILNGGATFPAAWCEEIPSITPEPGDICEFWDDDVNGIISRYSSSHLAWEHCRVLARKPKGYEEARDACADFVVRWVDGAIPQRVAAYERFLAEILGVHYARVE